MSKKVESIELIFENNDWIKISSNAIRKVYAEDFYQMVKIEKLIEEDYIIARYFSIVIDIKKLDIKITDYGADFIEKVKSIDLTQVQINYSDETKRHFYVKFDGYENANLLQKNEFLNGNKYLMISVGSKK